MTARFIWHTFSVETCSGKHEEKSQNQSFDNNMIIYDNIWWYMMI